MNSEGQSESNSDLRRYEALLEMADLIVHHHELPELFSAMAERLHELVTAEVAHFSLYNPTNNTMQLHFWQGREKWHAPNELETFSTSRKAHVSVWFERG